MAAIVPFIPLILGAGGTLMQGDAANRDAKSQAMQLQQQAGQDRAVAQLEAGNRRRSARYAQSRALALAAASGAGASDPSVVNIISGLEGEGEFGALAAMYEGETSARGLEYAGKTQRSEGKAARNASYLKAGTTLLSGGSAWADKYGGGGFDNPGRGGSYASFGAPAMQDFNLDTSLVRSPRWG